VVVVSGISSGSEFEHGSDVFCNGTLYNGAQCEPFDLTYSYTNSQYSCVNILIANILVSYTLIANILVSIY